MKKIILILSLVFLFSCHCKKTQEPVNPHRYHKGDVCYCKLDNTKVVITEILNGDSYEVVYNNGSGQANATAKDCELE